MQTMEAPSTEKRLDDLNSRMAEGFGQVHREIDGLDERMTEGFKRVDGDIRELRGEIKVLRGEASKAFAAQKRETGNRFAGVDAALISINTRFDAMHRTMMRGFLAIGTINVTLFVALAGLHGF